MSIEFVVLLILLVVLIGPPRLSVPENIKGTVDIIIYIIIAIIVIKLLLGVLHINL